jgi:hypothetical protein
MHTDSPGYEGAISGGVIHVDDGKSVAIYRRHGMCWVADFQWGAGQLVDAASWFRFHAGVLRYSHSRRATALESMAPISPQLAEQIERLHRSANPAAPDRPESFPAPTMESGLAEPRRESERGATTDQFRQAVNRRD